ncbi:c-type cytochrome [bacterium]|nr:c-type cytochrome [bacterium]
MRQVAWAATLAIFTLFATAGPVLAQFEEDFGRGLIATFGASDGTRCQRIDPTVSFDWGSQSPDLRISDGKFSARWDGLLLMRTAGDYTLHAYVCGKARVMVKGEVVLEANTTQPQWVSGKPIELKFDWHPIQADFAKTQNDAQLQLFWSGPGFPLEPIPAEAFYHDIDKTIEQPFERGRELIAGYRCAACHDIQQQPAAEKAPSLARLDGNISEAWLTDWLRTHKPEEQTDTLRRMPHFVMSDDDVEAVVAYLLSDSKPRPAEKSLPTKGSVASGKNLVQTLGCMACHKIGELGTASVMGGPELTDIAAKRPKGYFLTWLADPSKLNPDHRMPVYDLNGKQRDDIASYLATLSHDNTLAKTPVKEFNHLLVEKGRGLVADNRCGSCHTLPGDATATPPTKRTTLGPGNLWQDACMAEPAAHDHRPGYRLPPEDREAIKTYVRDLSRAKHDGGQVTDAHWILTKNNCLACHPRGTSGGLSETAKQITEANTGLASLLPAMVPPSLNSVGDKLHDKALLGEIARTSGNHRPWLRVQMPKFALSPDQQQTLVDYFVSQDRIPDGAPATIKPPKMEGLAATVAGARLVTTDGFGCTSCHQVGSMIPPKAPLNAKGPDLSMLGDRIREPWFFRWVHDPARIVPRMEMPSVKLPVRGVLDNQVDSQLAAVWHVLNTPDFTPPKPDPVRIVRQSGQHGDKPRAVVLTDVIKQGPNDVLIKPLLIGLPTRNNVLYDLESASLLDWWVGDVARQRSEGKTWHWEIGGTGLLDHDTPQPELLLRDESGDLVPPQRDGQFYTRFNEYDYQADSLTWSQTLHFGKSEMIDLQARQQVSPQWTDSDHPVNAFTRSISLSQIPPGYAVGLRLPQRTLTGKFAINQSASDRIVFVTGDVRIEIEKAPGMTVDENGVVWLAADGNSLSMTYRLDLPGEIAAETPPIPVIQSKSVELNIVPGWTAQRLPLSTEMMPIAMDWQPDGTLVAGSLKGRVWKLTDTDGDGLEDSYQQFGDEFAAPYGVKAYAQYVDIINKYALLRLWDENQDGVVEKVTNLAHGWGHTEDYHDWAVGLPLDPAGNYYAAIPCEQNKRTPEAAALRGTVIKLVPTSKDPQQQTYKIEELTAGHRFPMGIALNVQHELFVTDNQGNWNPFNELNHVVPGQRYGFINAIDRKPGFAPPETPPSIAIPHPWTRSVNGICFLETPHALRQKLGYDLYGPWEGDLIGCEYDTRRLVRMSLDHVGDSIQGAVYPLTTDPPEDVEQGLLGPISCGVAPDGDIYVGNIRDAGWGGGNNVGTFTRLRPRSVHLPLGIDEVTATPTGFQIRFTDQVNSSQGILPSNYTVASYTRVSTPAYGGEDKQRQREEVASIALSGDRLTVTLTLESPLKEGFVYEFFLDDEIGGPGKKMWPKEAHYTLRHLKVE